MRASHPFAPHPTSLMGNIVPMVARPHTFEWALIQMKAGKKVRLPANPDWFSVCLVDDVFYHTIPDGSLVDLSNNWWCSAALLASDWTLYEGEEA